MAPTKKPTTADEVSINKRRLLEAEEQRIVSSWFQTWTSASKSPTQPHSNGNINPKTQSGNGLSNDLVDEDDEEFDFSADPEEAGLGFTAPPNSIGNDTDRQDLSTNDKLRRQLLGSKAKSGRHGQAGLVASKPIPQHQRNGYSNTADDGHDDTEGRTKIARPKAKGGKSLVLDRTTSDNKTRSASDSMEGVQGQLHTGTTSTRTSNSKKRPASYLDELLAKRSQKKNKASQLLPETSAKTKSTIENT